MFRRFVPQPLQPEAECVRILDRWEAAAAIRGCLAADAVFMSVHVLFRL